MVVYTVTKPAMAPIPKVMLLGSGCPGGALLCTNCFKVVYVVNRMAELAPSRMSVSEDVMGKPEVRYPDASSTRR